MTARDLPSLGVNVALVEDGRVLLTRREDFDVWCLPGGAVASGETVAEAAVRETREETGLDVALDRLVGVYFQSTGIHTCVFTAHAVGGSLRADPSEVTEIRRFGRAELPAEIMWWYRLRILRALDGGSGEVWHQDLVDTPGGADRQRLYALRDAAGIPRRAFYERFLAARGPRGEERQV